MAKRKWESRKLCFGTRSRLGGELCCPLNWTAVKELLKKKRPLDLQIVLKTGPCLFTVAEFLALGRQLHL